MQLTLSFATINLSYTQGLMIYVYIKLAVKLMCFLHLLCVRIYQ